MRSLLAALLWLVCAPLFAAEPTLVSYTASTFNDVGNNDETTASVSWEAGDIVLVVGAVSNNDSANRLATPTATGLTFSLLSSVNNDAAANDTQIFMWSATAAGTSSSAVTSVTSGGSGLASGIGVFVIRASDGLGTAQSIDNSTAKTISVTRGFANSHVVAVMGDWNQVNDVAVDATPTGTVRTAIAVSGQSDFFVVSFGDQGATGTTAYGITNHTGTVDMSGLAIEVRGTAGGGGSSPVPSIYQQH
jgi:hypothetical protein